MALLVDTNVFVRIAMGQDCSLKLSPKLVNFESGNVPGLLSGKLEKLFRAGQLFFRVCFRQPRLHVVIPNTSTLFTFDQITVIFNRDSASLGEVLSESGDNRGVFGKRQPFPCQESLGYIKHRIICA